MSDFFFCILTVKALCPGTGDPKEWDTLASSSTSPTYPPQLPDYLRPGQERAIPGKVRWGQEHLPVICVGGRKKLVAPGPESGQ